MVYSTAKKVFIKTFLCKYAPVEGAFSSGDKTKEGKTQEKDQSHHNLEIESPTVMKFYPVALLMVCTVVGLVTAQKNDDIIRDMIVKILHDSSSQCVYCIEACENPDLDECYRGCQDVNFCP